MRLLPLAVPALLALAACDPAGPSYQTGTEVPPTEASATASDQAILSADCGAEAYQYLVGGPLALAEELQVPGPKRILGPDEFVTKDYNPGRLTITSSDGDTVGRVICS